MPRKPRVFETEEAIQPVDYPIINGEPVEPEPETNLPEPMVEVDPVSEAIPVPEPAKASRPTPESHPHLFDFAGNPL